MEIPATMSAPRAKLDEGESILHTVEGLRKKGIFGNRFGALHVTERRVVFIKAVMNGLGTAIMNAKGAKPMLAFSRDGIQRAEKVAVKKQHALELSDGKTTERFLIKEADIDNVLKVLGSR